jgi:hypothetical protein
MSRTLALASIVALAAACGSSPHTVQPAAPPSSTWDVQLGDSTWNRENTAGTYASMGDEQLMNALEGAFKADTVIWCKLGGECWAEVRELSCDRAAVRCQATGVADIIDPESPRTPVATGDPAAALITVLDARGLCGDTSCTLGAVACFTNRHDEVSNAREGMQAHASYTCEVSRGSVPKGAP